MPVTKVTYSKQQEEDRDFFLLRKNQLMNARKNVFGQDIEALWRQADIDYLPHELSRSGRNKVEDYRSESYRTNSVPTDGWRSQKANSNPFIKIQSAISILIGQNPQGTFTPDTKQFQATNDLMYELYKRSWADVRIGQKKEFRKFVFNLSKYGWSCFRRYHKKVVRGNIMHIVNYNTDTDTYDLKKGTITDIDDVYLENKSPWSVWMDDMAKPDDPYSRRDWMWKEVYDADTFKEQFKMFPNAKQVEGKSYQGQAEENKTVQERRFESDNLVTMFFYENKVKDRFMGVTDDDVLIFSIPLPYEHKQLSLVDTYWTMRNAECPYGIGLPEIMRNNNTLLDQMRNMTIDQLRLSIYKMFFYHSSEQLGDEGGEGITIIPGKGVKVVDPKNISFLEIPGPGNEAWEGIKMLSDDIDADTGVTQTLEGQITGKTAFEISQTQNAALKRLATPLDNIKAALEWDAMLAVSLMQTVYSEPMVHRIADPALISKYLAEIDSDKDMYFIDPETGVFNAVQYRQFHLGLEQNAQGQFTPSEKQQFFTVKPQWLEWQGTIQIQAESILVPSPALDRQQKLELFNLITPLMANPQIPADLVKKAVKQIIKVYDEDPEDWLPETWLQDTPQQPQVQQPQQGSPPLQSGGSPQMQPGMGLPQLQQGGATLPPQGGLVGQEVAANQAI